MRLRNGAMASSRRRFADATVDVAEVGDLAVPTELFAEAIGEGVLGRLLSVHQHDLLRVPLTPRQPHLELTGVGVRRQTADLLDVGVDGHHLAVDLDLGLAADEAVAVRFD